MRDPARTREALLQAAFEEMHRSGFRGSDVETILARAGVTKGAMYHHFENKEALGYAVLDEVIARMTAGKWAEPLAAAPDPLGELIRILRATSLKPGDLLVGCPLNNISQEMSPLDEGFRERSARVFDIWRDAVAGALRRGKAQGQVAPRVDPKQAAQFFLALFAGFMALGKCHRDAAEHRAGVKMMVGWLESLRPEGWRA